MKLCTKLAIILSSNLDLRNCLSGFLPYQYDDGRLYVPCFGSFLTGHLDLFTVSISWKLHDTVITESYKFQHLDKYILVVS